MATAITEAPEVSDDKAPKPVKSKRLMVIIAALVILAAAGGGGYWFLSHKSEPSHSAAEQKPEAPAIYVPLENFTVNLQPENGDQFLQVAITLKLSGASVAEKLKTSMPEIRNCLLFLLSSKHASELITTAGKEKLSKEIQAQLNHLLEPGSTATAAPDAKVAADTTPAAPAAPAAAAAPSSSTETPATPPAAAEAEPAAAAEEKPAAELADLPITGVMFTSFIIQ